jgi:hypothetical protein
MRKQVRQEVMRRWRGVFRRDNAGLSKSEIPKAEIKIENNVLP